MTRKLARLLASGLLALSASLASCSGVEVDSDFDPETDFSIYASFAQLPLEGAPEHGDFAEERIASAIDAELSAKGLTKVSEDEASLLVEHRVTTGQEVVRKDPYYAFNEVDIHEMKTLTIDLVDARFRALVWRGTGSVRAGTAKTPEDREELIREVVGEILEQYPPGR